VIDFVAQFAAHWDGWWPQMLAALVVTVEITIGAFALGVVIGVFVAIGRLSRLRALRGFCLGYVEVVRGVPALVILFLLYFGLVPLGVVMDALPAAILGLGLSAGGYISEIFRAGIEAMHKGQRESGLAIGLTPGAVYRYIILPQATRIVLPPLLNMLIVLLKDSSLASLISAPEIMLRAKDIASQDFLPMQLFVFAGVMYFLMAMPLSLAVRRLEVYLRRGLGARIA
jgi:His/Glu/Gln/Arg/opine family amino acid ABC transporter permease subunit